MGRTGNVGRAGRPRKEGMERSKSISEIAHHMCWLRLSRVETKTKMGLMDQKYQEGLSNLNEGRQALWEADNQLELLTSLNGWIHSRVYYRSILYLKNSQKNLNMGGTSGG
jgi:hypothetical protein